MNERTGLIIVIVGFVALFVGLCVAELRYKQIMERLAREVDQ